MKRLLVPALLVVLVMLARPAAAIMHQRTLSVPDVGTVLYGISVPDDYDARQPRPLVLALHPGERAPYYGAKFMLSIVTPGLKDLHAIMVAPDCPWRGWNDPTAEKAVMALLQNVLGEYSIDRRRILVTGYSMGGRGTWFMESHHADLFTAAIVMAGSARDEPLDGLGKIPTYVLHSRADQTMPFEPAQRTAQELEKLGRVIKFEALEGLAHTEMGGYIEPLSRAGRWVAEHWGK